ncbi:glycosyltransferase family 2 protein [Paraconexibacter antarcticus]|uniref:Glycosyltransferase family 2 protein n=1 Tax=Paraconexibacter antarcticus TaxID=2949664 RepID=A0ABY5E0I4_9ACTN|nr:glycosyltransferase family A protein [Paraconexibacter antarcticus]UTI66607.1 glycosyltransferase family 2 protein [Paraconexibacter antarcticus]
MSVPDPLISVCVPSHERPLRLRWLLNALAEQTLDRGQWEVVVCDDSRSAAVARLLATHPLREAGVLRPLRAAPGARDGSAARQRNVAWRAARAPLVLFTDDDCRPPRDWLAAALAAAGRHPGAIVQGATQPDPDEVHLMAAPHARTQAITPPVPWAQTCNVLYPRAVLEAAGGFEEHMAAGEDTELALRARAAGAAYVGAPEVLTHHAVEAGSLRGKLRTVPRWRGLALVVRRHPEVRKHLVARVFWRRSHALLPVAVLGAALAPRTRGRSLLAVLPYVHSARGSYGPGLRGQARALAEVPGRAVVDAAEIAALARGSAEQRTLIL